MKGVKHGSLVLGYAQSALGDGDPPHRLVYGLNVPTLILIEAISVALFVIDFNGPAVASDARDAVRVPVQCGGDEERGGIRQIRVAMGDDEPLLPNVRDVRGVAVTVRGLLIAFRGNREWVKDRGGALLEGVMGLLLQLKVKRLSRLCA